MPGIWAHSLFWEQQPAATTFDHDFLLLGVGRGAVAFMLFGLQDQPWWITLLFIGFLMATTLRNDLKGIAYRMLGGDDAEFLGILHGPDGALIKKIVDKLVPDNKTMRHSEERAALEKCYTMAKDKGIPLSGWELRMVIYYYVGKRLGRW